MLGQHVARRLRLSGAVLILAGAWVGALAWAQMRATIAWYGVICGAEGAPPHCAGCYAGAALAVAGLGLIVMARLVSAEPARTA